MSKKQLSLTKKQQVEISVFLNVENEDDIKVLTKEEEQNLDKNNIPDNIFQFKSTWNKPSMTLQSIIDANSMQEKMVAGKINRFFSTEALLIAHIRCLLKSWNLIELDPQMILEFETSIDSKNVKILSFKTMERIGEVSPNIIIAMYNAMFTKLFIGESELPKLEAKQEELKT